MEKLRLVLLLFLAVGCNKQPAPAPTPEPQATPAPLKRKALKLKRRQPAPTPTAVVPQPTPTFDISEKNLFESVAFKGEEEVKGMLGEPDAKLTHVEEDSSDPPVSSWYYLREAKNPGSDKVCPEVRFIQGKGRSVLFWTPQAMRSLVSEAKAAASSKASPSKKTFTFKEGFKYLGVGTPQKTVLEDMGEPDSRRALEGGAEAWDYDTQVVENGTPKRLTVIVKNGKVVEVKGKLR